MMRYRYRKLRDVQQLVCQWRRSASPAAAPNRWSSAQTTRWAIPGSTAVEQPGQMYVFSALRAVMVRTIQSPSGALSRRANPARARSRSSSGAGPAPCFPPPEAFPAGPRPDFARRGRLERGMPPFCLSRWPCPALHDTVLLHVAGTETAGASAEKVSCRACVSS
jgi:hypothetical protein